MSAEDWVPPLVQLETYRGDWNLYIEALYDFFKKDFVYSRPIFQGSTLALKRHPVIQNKEATFWHLLSEGKIEENRLPDLRRCERIRWPRPIIEHETDCRIKIWHNKRGREIRTCLWLEDREYLVVLVKRKGYILLWTAYPVTENHSKRKLQREYNSCKC